jgi:chorismate-pyruvate lyase
MRGSKRGRLDAARLGRIGLFAVIAVATLSASAGAASPDEASQSALAQVRALNADLLTHDSATETLQRWCAARHLADPAQIVAHRILGEDKPATAEVRRRLHAQPAEPIAYRRVALACGDHVLSNADNWYRPGALTAPMNTELEATDHPFGAVVRPLSFHRRTLRAAILICAKDRRPPADVIRHEAVLETPDGTPFSLVIETYTAEVLDQGSAGLAR